MRSKSIVSYRVSIVELKNKMKLTEEWNHFPPNFQRKNELYYIIYSVNTTSSESNCSYSSQESASVNYRITGYVQFYVDIYEYNDVDWTIIINDGNKKYLHKVNNKLSPYIIIPINIYSDNLEKITMTSSVPFKTPINNTFINLIVESCWYLLIPTDTYLHF